MIVGKSPDPPQVSREETKRTPSQHSVLNTKSQSNRKAATAESDILGNILFANKLPWKSYSLTRKELQTDKILQCCNLFHIEN